MVIVAYMNAYSLIMANTGGDWHIQFDEVTAVCILGLATIHMKM